MVSLAITLILIGICILAGMAALFLLGTFIAAILAKGIGQNLAGIINEFKKKWS